MTSEQRPRLPDLVANGTMSPGIAATLVAAARERRSLLLVAVPRNAGKTTTMRAALDYVPPRTPVHHLRRSESDLGIPARGDGAYLFMAEIADVGFDDYLWGDEVRHVFAALERGFALATALHAPGIDEAFSVICDDNEVPDSDASRIDLAAYIHTDGPWQAPTRRRIAELREIEHVEGGRPLGRTLFRWRAPDDSFEAVEPARTVGTTVPGGVVGLRAEFEHA